MDSNPNRSSSNHTAAFHRAKKTFRIRIPAAGVPADMPEQHPKDMNSLVKLSASISKHLVSLAAGISESLITYADDVSREIEDRTTSALNDVTSTATHIFDNPAASTMHDIPSADPAVDNRPA